MNWIMTTLTWYLYIFAVGLIFLPLATKIFNAFIDKGYAFAKTIGVLLTSYILFVLGTAKIYPFSREGILFFLILVFIVNIHFFSRSFLKEWKKLKGSQIYIIALEELLFAGGLFFLTYVRGQQPAINGLEKFMDYGFMQSILRSRYFPPLDMWYAADLTHLNGFAINYYYFGHLSGALLTKLTNIPSVITYNLILATILGQALALSFSIVSNLGHLFFHTIKERINARHMVMIILVGLVGTFLVNFGGNFHTIYIATTGYPNEQPKPFWEIMQSKTQIQETMQREHLTFFQAMVRNSSYWYPNATRFIPYTIHEFPSYSYVVADLHGHVFDIPFVLLSIGFVVLILSQERKKGKEHASAFSKMLPHIEKGLHRLGFSVDTVPIAALFGFMVAVHYMTNAFDGPMYLLLFFVTLFLLYRLTRQFFFMAGATVLFFILFSLPFSIHFQPFATGIGVNCSPDFLTNLGSLGPFLFEKGNCQISAIWMLFVLWGFFVLCFLLLLGALKQSKIKPNHIDMIVIAFFCFSLFLITVPEFFYIKDIYPLHFRANTMFKMGYQAFILMSIGSAYALFRLFFVDKKWMSVIGIVIFFVIFLPIFIYPFFAFPSYYGDSVNWKTPELDGSNWMIAARPQDKEIIDYINSTIPGQPVILEAQGDSYTEFDRVSAYTGNPTVAGWWVHEWLWRGTTDVVGNRIPDIVTIYESHDLAQTREMLHNYRVGYVVVSELERNKYPHLYEEKFNEIGRKIFESSNGLGSLYQVF